jgi:hypothetical protein
LVLIKPIAPAPAETSAPAPVPAWQAPGFLGNNFDKPLPLTPLPPLGALCAPPPPTVTAFELPSDMPILIIFNRFLELILSGDKTIEMRPSNCPDKIGKRIALSPSGAGDTENGFYVLGTAVIDHSLCRPKNASDATRLWVEGVQRAACVGGDWPTRYDWLWGTSGT